MFAFLKNKELYFLLKIEKIFAILWTKCNPILILYLHCAVLDKRNGITKYLESVSYMLRRTDGLLSLY
jgi:hypothetical protein